MCRRETGCCSVRATHSRSETGSLHRIREARSEIVSRRCRPTATGSGNWRRLGNVHALSAVTILVGNVRDGVDDAVGSGIRVGALHHLLRPALSQWRNKDMLKVSRWNKCVWWWPAAIQTTILCGTTIRVSESSGGRPMVRWCGVHCRLHRATFTMIFLMPQHNTKHRDLCGSLSDVHIFRKTMQPYIMRFFTHHTND